MKYLFYLSGENEKLAKAEVEFLLKSYSEFRLIQEDRQILVCEGSLKSLRRLALTHEICEFIASCEIGELHDVFESIDFPNAKLCVRLTNIGGKKLSTKAERELGAILWRRGAKISVSNPEVVVKVYLSSRAFVGFLIHKTDTKQFLIRKPTNKPFFMPNVVLPRFARALVNLSGVKENELLLDPMCGTGTFLIEAGLMGIRILGVEPFEKILRGCRKNLEYYSLEPNVLIGDAKKLPFKDNSVDSIVTDFPYLQSTKSYGDLIELYHRATEEFSRVLKPEKCAVIVSNIDIDELLDEYFNVINKFYQRIHRNLTRRIYLCRH